MLFLLFTNGFISLLTFTPPNSMRSETWNCYSCHAMNWTHIKIHDKRNRDLDKWQHYLCHPNEQFLCLIIRYNLLAVCLASILLMCQHTMIDIYLYICIRNAGNFVWCWRSNVENHFSLRETSSRSAFFALRYTFCIRIDLCLSWHFQMEVY